MPDITTHTTTISKNCNNKIYELLKSKSECDHHKAMDLIISQSELELKGEQYFLQVIKISDTRNIKLKMKINSYLSNYGSNHKLLVLTTNTLLKDLNDDNIELRYLAIDFIGKITYMDEYFVSNFVNLARTGNSEMRKRIAKNMLKIFYNMNWVVKYDMISLLNEMLMDRSNLYALEIVYQIYDDYKIYQLSDIILLIEKNLYCYEGQLILFMIIERFIIDHKTMKDIEIIDVERICINELNSPKIELNYFAAKILIRIDKKHSQIVYNNLIKYIKNSTVKSFFILKFLRSMIQSQLKYDFYYENNDFVLYENDPIYIKKIKLDILFFQFDQTTITETEKCMSNEKMMFDCLYLLLKKAITNKKLLNDCLKIDDKKVLNILYLLMPVNDAWLPIIVSELQNYEKKYKLDNKYLYVMSNVVNKINDLCLSSNQINENDKIKCLMILYFREVVDKHILVERLNEIFLGQKLVKVLLENNIKRLKNYCFKKVEKILKYDSYDGLFDKYLSLSNENHEEYTDDIRSNKSPLVYNTKFIKDENNEGINKQRNFLELFFIEEKYFTCKFLLEEKKIILSIFKIIEPVKISIIPYFDKIFSEKEKICLFEINDTFKSRSIQFTTNITYRTLLFRLKDFSIPFNTTLKVFNDAFLEIKNYEIIETCEFTCKAYYIEDNILTFMILGNYFYAMIMSGQMVIKCENQCILKSLLDDLRYK
ncbi:hypothetical protein COBT_002963 [Conglomerata obtusa]